MSREPKALTDSGGDPYRTYGGALAHFGTKFVRRERSMIDRKGEWWKATFYFMDEWQFPEWEYFVPGGPSGSWGAGLYLMEEGLKVRDELELDLNDG